VSLVAEVFSSWAWAATLPSSTVRQSHTKAPIAGERLRGSRHASDGGRHRRGVRRDHLVWPCPHTLPETASMFHRVDTEGSSGQLPSPGKPVDACSPDLEALGDCRRPQPLLQEARLISAASIVLGRPLDPSLLSGLSPSKAGTQKHWRADADTTMPDRHDAETTLAYTLDLPLLHGAQWDGQSSRQTAREGLLLEGRFLRCASGFAEASSVD
jgi:hypothetical protein